MVKYHKTIRSIEGYNIKCEICVGDDELSHTTDVESFENIISDMELTPSFTKGERGGKVSFSADPEYIYGKYTHQWEVKIILDKNKVGVKLDPVCYYDLDRYYDEMKDIWVKIAKKLNLEMELLHNIPKNIELVNSEIKMQPKSYIDECEWQTRYPVKLNSDNLKRVEFVKFLGEKSVVDRINKVRRITEILDIDFNIKNYTLT